LDEGWVKRQRLLGAAASTIHVTEAAPAHTCTPEKLALLNLRCSLVFFFESSGGETPTEIFYWIWKKGTPKLDYKSQFERFK
jgi:hypothetical protein